MDIETGALVALRLAPARAYRELLYRPTGELSQRIGERYEVVARPGQTLPEAPRAGDVLFSVTLGEPGGGRCDVLAYDTLIRRSSARGASAGWYCTVNGATPYQRRILGPGRQLPPGHLLLRARDTGPDELGAPASSSPHERSTVSDPDAGALSMPTQPVESAAQIPVDHRLCACTGLRSQLTGPATNGREPFWTTDGSDDSEPTVCADVIESTTAETDHTDEASPTPVSVDTAATVPGFDTAERTRPFEPLGYWSAEDFHKDDVERIDVGPGSDTDTAVDTSGGTEQDYVPNGKGLSSPEDPAGGVQPETLAPTRALWGEDLNGGDVPMTLPPPNPPRPDPQQEKCQKKWQTELVKLPSAAQTALSHKLYPLAVGLAIHSGLRDAKLLTDMVFMNEYGPRRGYCPLTSAEELYVRLWQDISKEIVLPRLAVPLPPLAQAGGIVCVAHKDRHIAKPAPDNPAFDVTGHYEPRVTGVAPPYTFRINQAGRHVEAVLTTVIRPMGTVNKRDVYRYHGDLQSDGSYLLFNYTKPDQRVTLRHDARTGSVSLDTAGTIEQLDLVAPVPTLMETTLDYLPVTVRLVRNQEWFPLTRVQVRHIIDSLSPSKIEPYLKRYFDTPGGDLVAERAALRKAARPLDDYLDKVFNDDKVGIHYVDRPLAVAYAQTILGESRWKYNLTRSHLDWIQILLNMVAQGDRKGDFRGIQTHLGLHPGAGANDPAAPQHTYRVTLKLTGGGMFLSGYTGTITLEKTNAPFWPQSSAWPNGKASFGIRLGGLDSGADISIGSEIEGSATTSQMWQPPDIPGTVSMVQGGIGVPGVGAAAGFLHINGSEIFPPISVVFSDVGFKVPTSVPKSRKDLIPIPDLGGYWGTIQTMPFPDIDYTTVRINPAKAVDSGLTEDVHFCLDGAILTEDARQALRIMCANELAALMSTASRLTINGHTDRSDTDQRNLELSTMRAENTFQAIKDILADNLRIPNSHIVKSGKGETEAIHDKRPDGERIPKYRRVDVILDGRLVLALRAQ
jgi:outer membrane protein OmpA-like peptidoglycan-associated protein